MRVVKLFYYINTCKSCIATNAIPAILVINTNMLLIISFVTLCLFSIFSFFNLCIEYPISKNPLKVPKEPIINMINPIIFVIKLLKILYVKNHINRQIKPTITSSILSIFFSICFFKLDISV